MGGCRVKVTGGLLFRLGEEALRVETPDFDLTHEFRMKCQYFYRQRNLLGLCERNIYMSKKQAPPYQLYLCQPRFFSFGDLGSRFSLIRTSLSYEQ